MIVLFEIELWKVLKYKVILSDIIVLETTESLLRWLVLWENSRDETYTVISLSVPQNAGLGCPVLCTAYSTVQLSDRRTDRERGNIY